jgi:hypothetical protein
MAAARNGNELVASISVPNDKNIDSGIDDGMNVKMSEMRPAGNAGGS